MDTPEVSPPAEDVELSLDEEMDFHKTLLAVCDQIGKQKKPHAPFAFNSVVPHKPTDLENARDRVRPEDFEQMKQRSAGGSGFFIIRKVWRDAVIDALVNKALATKMAVATLASAGFGADAYALTRHLFENIIVVAWLLRPKDEVERAKRIDTYVAHFEAFKVRLEEVTRSLTRSLGEAESPIGIADLRTKEIAAEVFQDKWMYWSWFRNEFGKQTLVRLKDMVDEIGFRTPYDTDYFTMSAFVHSAPASIFGTTDTGPADIGIDRGYFAFDPDLFRAPGFAVKALGMSNVYFLHLLIELNIAFKFGWDVDRIIKYGKEEREATEVRGDRDSV